MLISAPTIHYYIAYTAHRFALRELTLEKSRIVIILLFNFVPTKLCLQYDLSQIIAVFTLRR